MHHFSALSLALALTGCGGRATDIGDAAAADASSPLRRHPRRRPRPRPSLRPRLRARSGLSAGNDGRHPAQAPPHVTLVGVDAAALYVLTESGMFSPCRQDPRGAKETASLHGTRRPGGEGADRLRARSGELTRRWRAERSWRSPSAAACGLSTRPGRRPPSTRPGRRLREPSAGRRDVDVLPAGGHRLPEASNPSTSNAHRSAVGRPPCSTPPTTHPSRSGAASSTSSPRSMGPGSTHPTRTFYARAHRGRRSDSRARCARCVRPRGLDRGGRGRRVRHRLFTHVRGCNRAIRSPAFRSTVALRSRSPSLGPIDPEVPGPVPWGLRLDDTFVYFLGGLDAGERLRRPRGALSHPERHPHGVPAAARRRCHLDGTSGLRCGVRLSRDAARR